MNNLSIIFPPMADGKKYFAYIKKKCVEGTNEDLRATLNNPELSYILYRTSEWSPKYYNFCYNPKNLKVWNIHNDRYNNSTPGRNGLAIKRISYKPCVSSVVEQCLDTASEGSQVKRTSLSEFTPSRGYYTKRGTTQTVLEDSTHVVLRQKSGGGIISGYTFNPRTLVSSVYKDGKFVLPDGKEVATILRDAIDTLRKNFPIR